MGPKVAEAGGGRDASTDRSAGKNSSSLANFVSASGYHFNDRDRKTVKLKLRRGLARNLFNDTNAGNKSSRDGNESGTANDDDGSGATPGSNSSPIIPEMDPKTMALFPTGRPRETVLDTVICKHCKKPVLRVSAAEHVRGCYKAKQEKQRKKKEARDAANKLKHGDKDKDKSKSGGYNDNENDDGDIPSVNGSVKTSKKSAMEDNGGNKKGKKRKADNDEDKDNASTATGAGAAANNSSTTGGTVKKKKKKDEPKKPPKYKGPVDVERQCGVQLPNGGQCARSLTCKSHSMGAKRAVPGRSLPYDMLLQAYQKKNQARQQKAAIDANAPVADEDDGPGKVDSDQEKELCMMGIERMWKRREAGSLVGHRLVSTRMKYRVARVREMFRQAIGGEVPARSGGGSGMGLFGGFINGIGRFGGGRLAPSAVFGGGREMPLNFFGPDTFMLNKPTSTTTNPQPTGHAHGAPVSAANVPTTQPQSATSTKSGRLSLTLNTAAASHDQNQVTNDSTSANAASSPASTTGNWKRQGNTSMSQQAQVNAASAAGGGVNSSAKKVAAPG